MLSLKVFPQCFLFVFFFWYFFRDLPRNDALCVMYFLVLILRPNMSFFPRPVRSHLSGIWAPGCCTRLLLRPAPSLGRTAALRRFRCHRCRTRRKTAALRGGRDRPHRLPERRWRRTRRTRTGGDGAGVAADGAAAADAVDRPERPAVACKS